jgi:hypothetical protein
VSSLQGSSTHRFYCSKFLQSHTSQPQSESLAYRLHNVCAHKRKGWDTNPSPLGWHALHVGVAEGSLLALSLLALHIRLHDRHPLLNNHKAIHICNTQSQSKQHSPTTQQSSLFLYTFCAFPTSLLTEQTRQNLQGRSVNLKFVWSRRKTSLLSKELNRGGIKIFKALARLVSNSKFLLTKSEKNLPKSCLC